MRVPRPRTIVMLAAVVLLGACGADDLRRSDGGDGPGRDLRHRPVWLDHDVDGRHRGADRGAAGHTAEPADLDVVKEPRCVPRRRDRGDRPDADGRRGGGRSRRGRRWGDRPAGVDGARRHPGRAGRRPRSRGGALDRGPAGVRVGAADHQRRRRGTSRTRRASWSPSRFRSWTRPPTTSRRARASDCGPAGRDDRGAPVYSS